MLAIDIPGRGQLQIEHLVLDVNGTLAVDGVLIEGVAAGLERLEGLGGDPLADGRHAWPPGGTGWPARADGRPHPAWGRGGGQGGRSSGSLGRTSVIAYRPRRQRCRDAARGGDRRGGHLSGRDFGRGPDRRRPDCAGYPVRPGPAGQPPATEGEPATMSPESPESLNNPEPTPAVPTATGRPHADPASRRRA